MKRWIHAAENVADSQFCIVAYDSDDRLGYVFNYAEPRGMGLCRVSDDINKAKKYNSLASAKRVKARYNNFMELYLYDDANYWPIVEYLDMSPEKAAELNEKSYRYEIKSTRGLRLEVEPV